MLEHELPFNIEQKPSVKNYTMFKKKSYTNDITA